MFVTANAGSGKTKVLVDRIARLLLEGSKPSAFLCITYTKAAAAEMQRRLFERLGGWCVADDATLAHELKKLGAPKRRSRHARARCSRKRSKRPAACKIQTIHAFCERLLARFPLEAGVPPGFDIADEARAAALVGGSTRRGGARRRTRRATPSAASPSASTAITSKVCSIASRCAAPSSTASRKQHQGELFAAHALRDRHGVSADAEDYTRAFLARWRLERTPRRRATLCEGSANDCKTGERLRAVLDCVERDDEPRGDAAPASRSR